MRNLIRIHCKRFLFRWETFAVTLLNILLMVIGVLAARLMFDPETMNFDFYSLIHVITLVSVLAVLTAVIFIEINTLSTGAIRNPLIAGYSKGQVFLSKYISVIVFSAVQGAIVLLPTVLANVWTDRPVSFTLSMLLVYMTVYALAMTVCLLSDRPTVYVVILFGVLLGLLFGGTAVSEILNRPQYQGIDLQEDHIDKLPNPWYLPSPKRDILEQVHRLNPMQPLVEYQLYLENFGNYAYTTQYFETALNQAEDDLHREYAGLLKQQWEERYIPHIRRLELFPYYQCGLLLMIGAGGILLFRTRNLK